MNDHIIELGTSFANELGFTPDKFDGYLWKSGEHIVISFIISLQERRGNLKRLFKTIQDKGFGIKVPTSFARMKKICMEQGFRRTEDWFEEADCSVEVWVKNPKSSEFKEKGENEVP